MKKLLIAVALMMVMVGNAEAIEFNWPYQASLNGHHLLKKCDSSTKLLEQVHCIGFIQGVSDSIDYLTFWWEKDMYVCKPNEVTGGDLQLIIIKYLKDHAVGLHQPASYLVFQGLKEAFPCPAINSTED